MNNLNFLNDTEKVNRFCEANSIRYLALFGSFARNEETENSDVDLLVDFVNTPGFFRFIKIENNLSNKLGRKVDLVTKNSLSKHIKPNIESDLKTIYEKS